MSNWLFAKAEGNSMYPTICDGDILILKRDYQIGDIVSFIQKDNIITHRIIGRKTPHLVLTKGDNNIYVDSFEEAKQVIGSVAYILRKDLNYSCVAVTSSLNNKQLFISKLEYYLVRILNPISKIGFIQNFIRLGFSYTHHWVVPSSLSRKKINSVIRGEK